MQLSAEARKRALEAYRGEFITDFAAIRTALCGDLEWDLTIKSKLHKLKGGASFLGFEEIRKALSQLETQALHRPLDLSTWYSELSRLESLLEGLS
jgi:HPt (histidine-containing phosphotransfer) domain-containing protein